MAADLFSQRLADTEAQFDKLSQLLVHGDAPAYEAAAARLRQQVLQLAQSSGQLAAPLAAAQAQRLHRLAELLTRQRDQLARRAVAVERGLAVLLPQPQPTYQALHPGGGFGPAAPRIYSAPAR